MLLIYIKRKVKTDRTQNAVTRTPSTTGYCLLHFYQKEKCFFIGLQFKIPVVLANSTYLKLSASIHAVFMYMFVNDKICIKGVNPSNATN
jgi:hypothetical protein